MTKEKDIFAKPKFKGRGRKWGAMMILIGIGLPFLLSFFQDSGDLIFFSRQVKGERTLTPREISEIKRIVEERKSRLSGIEKAVESVKETYRKQMGEDYYRDVWVVRTRSGFLIPFKYMIALGGLFVLIGLAKLILG